VEDEPHAMLLLQDHISKIPQLELLAGCYDALSAMNFLKDQQVDLIFLDINMPKLSGLEMAAMLPKNQKLVITTAYSEHALESFDFHVIDYLLKPISFKRFMQAIHKLESFEQPEPVMANPVPGGRTNNFLFVKTGKQVRRIDYDSIYYIEALKEYIAIHTINEKMLVYKRMKEVEQQLPEQFVRIHNSFIVNISHIRNIQSNLVSVKSTELPVSSGYKTRFMERIQLNSL
jgi:DNA-binding LytR/AlgR family response regulator